MRGFEGCSQQCQPEALFTFHAVYAKELKTSEEVINYVGCYANLAAGKPPASLSSQDPHPNPGAAFGPYLSDLTLAANVFLQIPSLLACWGLRESTWKEGLVSPAGARGLVQFTQKGVEGVNQALADPSLQALWQRYLRENDLSGPEQIRLSDMEKPEINLGAAAAFTSYMANQILRQLSLVKFPGQISPLDFSVLVAMAGNCGWPTLNKALVKYLKARKNRLGRDWLEKIPVPNETRNLGKSVRICMAKDDWRPPVNFFGEANPSPAKTASQKKSKTSKAKLAAKKTPPTRSKLDVDNRQRVCHPDNRKVGPNS